MDGPVPHREIILIATRWRSGMIKKAPDIKPPLLIEVVICLIIAHRNGLPLDIDALLVASEEDLDHDVGGIYTHIDRGTGKLGGLFAPRLVLQAA